MQLRFTQVFVSFALCAFACNDKARPAPPHDGSHGGSKGALTTFADFEGEIELTVKGSLGGAPPPTRTTQVTLLVKDGRLRVPLPDVIPVTAGLGLAYFLIAPRKKQLYAVSDNKLQATVIDLEELLAHAEREDGQGKLASPETSVPATETDRIEHLAGYSCEVWSVQLARVTMDLCVAEVPSPWLRVPLGATGSKYPWAAKLCDGSHLPLRIVTRVRDTEHGRIEVTRIERRTVPADSFQVPANYAVTTFTQLLESLSLHAPSSTEH